jgi:formylglycine-generating enzyme required for sulfatase activity
VSEEVEAVIARAVAVNPKLRWPNIRDFWSALIEATPLNAARVPVSVPTPPIRRLDEGIQDSRPPAAQSGLRMTLVAVMGVAILGAIVVLIGFVFRRRPSVMPAKADASTSATPSAVASSSANPPVTARPMPEGMIHIPAGTFTMGKDTDGKGDRPAHRVVLTHAFHIDRTEVTIDKYSACVEQGSCTSRIVHLRKNASGAWGCNLEKDHGSYPANCVDRKQAFAYCAFANKRLPTEAEWEYAARGSDERDYPWGSGAPTRCSLAVLSGMAGACGDRHGASPVGTAPDGASPFGVLDMGGNVWEWVADDYAAYPSDEVTDPLVTVTDRSEPLRGVLRGGAWDYGPESAKTTYRLPFITEAGNASIGIRCALSE